ncbi:MtrB/PioB family decaheme-associated outer membrane protein [Aquincola sp. S2]|uniref:MtrB/PioB family decaheme-associated outer membrane protein n=1 Tax=Pseudaquabacterium terrae TaxID=2732868 RepID=A0ABX2ER20_9BURK|nr:MtrB/PioB family decaheme-associated outer membrane protein [Aquabacterium terrae]NRF71073.1 MtrB/PioB family decaheme-associated outer membrane protein [Aquabacterium terrae]
MKSHTPLWLLGALGALAAPAFAVDTAAWKCETCPFEAGSSGSIDAGLALQSGKSAKFADYSGYDRSGAHVLLGGTLRHRGADGLFADLAAADLGLDSRSLAAELGREGRYALRFGYSQLPRHLTDSATTPFLGHGGAVLTLPAGFPAPTTAAMPLAATLQPVDIGYDRKILDLGATLPTAGPWSWRADLRHERREGTQRGAGSFFSTTSQLVLPVDQVTDRLELAAAYSGHALQATLGYHASIFRSHTPALTWSNPFSMGTLSAPAGQLALAPDNQLHQLIAAAAWSPGGSLRFSGDLAFGRLTQDEPFVAATLNPALTVPALPAASLHGRVDTLDANLRVSAQPLAALRVHASVTRNQRDNRTPALTMPLVATDLFSGVGTRTTLPHGFTRDRFRLGADHRGPGSLKLAGGLEHERIERTLQAARITREDTLWLRGSVQVRDNVGMTLKLAHAQRKASDYRPVEGIEPPENPLLRKFNQADRRRSSAALRSDLSFGENLALGVAVDVAVDDYTRSAVGLTDARSADVSADLAYAVSEATRLSLFAQADAVQSVQAGSQSAGNPDWTGRVKDRVALIGAGVTYSALKGRLELGANLAVSRARSETIVRTGASAPPFPAATTELDSLKLFAQWRFNDQLSLHGSYRYERTAARDWQLDGVQPATVPNLLAFGEQPPRGTVHLLGLVLRYRF